MQPQGHDHRHIGIRHTGCCKFLQHWRQQAIRRTGPGHIADDYRDLLAGSYQRAQCRRTHGPGQRIPHQRALCAIVALFRFRQDDA